MAVCVGTTRKGVACRNRVMAGSDRCRRHGGVADVREEDVADSDAFRSARNKAEEYARDPEKTRKLLEEAAEKARQHKKRKGPLGELIDQLLAMMRMIRAWFNGSYREVPWESLVWAIAAVAYFVMPLDAIPDVVPGIGYLDDALVIGLVLRSIHTDLENFRLWAAAQQES